MMEICGAYLRHRYLAAHPLDISHLEDLREDFNQLVPADKGFTDTRLVAERHAFFVVATKSTVAK